MTTRAPRWLAGVFAAALLSFPMLAFAAPAHVTISAKHGVARYLGMHMVTHSQQLALAKKFRAMHAGKSFPMFTVPFRTGANYRQLKLNAARNPLAPRATRVLSENELFGVSPDLTTPKTVLNFEGMADSGFICFPCEPPDMGLASGPSHIMQAVNSAVATFAPSTKVMELGWPLPTDSFLGGGPSGLTSGCDTVVPGGAFLSDPRMFYDARTGRFWYSIVQIDGVDFIGDSCPDESFIWYAVSVDSNPNDGFLIYHFQVDEGNTQIADYPTLGYDDTTHTVSSGFNDFGFTDGYTHNDVLVVDKAAMEAGSGSPAHTLYTGIFCSGGTCGGGVFIDTIEPVVMNAKVTTDPGAQYYIFSLNINSGGGECSTGCSGYVVAAATVPLTSFAVSAVSVSSLTYTLAPAADVATFGGACSMCVETLDTRISAQPQFSAAHGGVVTWALESGVSNGTMVVPSVLWVETKVTPPSSGFAASNRQMAYITGSGDISTSFGTTIRLGNDLLVMTDVMSGTKYPGVVFQLHNDLTDANGVLEGAAILKRGTGPDIFDGRWGDYEAASTDGTHVWLSSEFINGGGDWDTWIGEPF